jgi:hypothetical protein
MQIKNRAVRGTRYLASIALAGLHFKKILFHPIITPTPKSSLTDNIIIQIAILWRLSEQNQQSIVNQQS